MKLRRWGRKSKDFRLGDVKGWWKCGGGLSLSLRRLMWFLIFYVGIRGGSLEWHMEDNVFVLG